MPLKASKYDLFRGPTFLRIAESWGAHAGGRASLGLVKLVLPVDGVC